MKTKASDDIILVYGGSPMKRRTLFILFSVAFIVALGATPLTVSWIDGRVEKKNGSNWVDLNMGDRLDSASTVRLGPGATAEFVAGERRISLTASGVFVLDSLLKRGTEGAERRSGMLDKLAALVDPTARTTDTTVAGVRGNLIGDQSSGDMTWESDNADVDAIMTSAQQLVRDKHYAEAAEKFRRGCGCGRRRQEGQRHVRPGLGSRGQRTDCRVGEDPAGNVVERSLGRTSGLASRTARYRLGRPGGSALAAPVGIGRRGPCRRRYPVGQGHDSGDR